MLKKSSRNWTNCWLAFSCRIFINPGLFPKLVWELLVRLLFLWLLEFVSLSMGPKPFSEDEKLLLLMLRFYLLILLVFLVFFNFFLAEDDLLLWVNFRNFIFFLSLDSLFVSGERIQVFIFDFLLLSLSSFEPRWALFFDTFLFLNINLLKLFLNLIFFNFLPAWLSFSFWSFGSTAPWYCGSFPFLWPCSCLELSELFSQTRIGWE